ncbi:MAG: hypothetical protein LJE83_09780, partial [Gammaproteobacteria bacterium]|nr:hypothetical protein [Gammaproteobacteria bacterium]
MYKKVIYTSLIFNLLLLIGSGINYKYIVLPLNNDMEHKLDEQTASLAIKSSKIIQAYSEQEKIENLDKIIFLYGK